MLTYSIREVMPYINWIYFYFAWGLAPKQVAERERLRREAEAMLGRLDGRYRTYATFGLFDANGDGDDLLLDGVRLPLLRQQQTGGGNDSFLCLSDFVRPLSQGVTDCVGVFAATVDAAMEKDFAHDVYDRMMAQTLADRLAEATAEKMHREVRMHDWGYAPEEHLTMEQLWQEQFQGIRPAVGYPSLPDQSVIFVLSSLVNFKSIGIRLTENGAMMPHASVAGLMIAHPQSHYFAVGKIGEDQLKDYASRRGLPLELMRKFLAANIS